MGPSILQTLLKEPTRNYQTIYTDPASRPASPTYVSKKNRASSVRSTSSARSATSSIANSATSAGGGAVRDAAWRDGRWEWSAFGGRGGLTGGPGSLVAGSVVGHSLGLRHDSSAARRAASLLSAGEYEDERASVRSGRSGRSGMSQDSVRTSMSAPGMGEGGNTAPRRTKKKSTRTSSSLREGYAPPSSGYDPRPRTQSFGADPTSSRSAFRSGLSPSMSSGSFIRHEGQQTSRRYSSLAALAAPSPSYPTSPNLSALSSYSSPPASSLASVPRRSHRSRSPLPHLPSDDTTPSLTSSASSAPSSPPATPIQAPIRPLPALEVDAKGRPVKEKKRKTQKTTPVSIEEAVLQVERVEIPAVKVQPEQREAPRQVKDVSAPTTSSSEETASAPTPVPGKFYSVDELFALAAPSVPSPTAETLSDVPTSTSVPMPAASSAVSAPPPVARTESDNASFTPALDAGLDTPALLDRGGPLLAGPIPVVPRLKLTRTESDQDRMGVKGAEDVEVSEGEGTIEEVSEEEEEEEEAEMRSQLALEEELEVGSSEDESEEESAAPVERDASVAFPIAAAPEPAFESAGSQPPQLAHFVQVTRTKTKRTSAESGPSPSRTYARATSPEPTYQVIRSSSSPTPPRSSSRKSPRAERDPAVRSPSPSNSAVSSSSSLKSDYSSAAASHTAAADVPDWLTRIRALGEPIQPLQPLTGAAKPKQKQQLVNPPTHWTVQQLRQREASNGSTSSSSSSSSSNGTSRPPINRPRSVGSLRARAKVMEPMPEDREAEAQAVAEDQAAKRASRSQGSAATPAWVKKGHLDGPALPQAISARSPSPNGSAHTSSSSTSFNRSRRTRSFDFTAADRERTFLSPTSPLSRSISLSSGGRGSRSGGSSYTDADIEAIAAAAEARPKTGLAKFLQPPLASSKAVRPAPLVAVTNYRSAPSSPSSSRPVSPSPSISPVQPVNLHDLILAAGREEPYHAYAPTVSRGSSLRELSPQPSLRQRASSLREYLGTPPPVQEERDEGEMEGGESESDLESMCGRSALSTMSAPQLSPVRPPKNPARRNSSSERMRQPPVPPIPASFASVSSSSPAIPPMASRSPSIASAAPVMSTIRTDSGLSLPRPLSRSFSEVERPSMHERKEPPPPVPVLPDFARPTTPSPAPSAPASILSPSQSTARPFSSLVAPASTTVSGPTSLALSPRIDFGKKKTSRRFGLFKRSSSSDLASSSTSGGKRFDASIDLVFEPLDANLLRKKLKSDEILIEVIAAGVDRWDRERVWAAAKGMGGAGFVGGRAVVGKVIEVGEAVGKFKKGEIVWGLNSIKRSSALASLIAISRDHASLAPTSTSLTFTSIASVPAAAATAMLIMSSLCAELPKGSKILVLNAHRGVGHLCLQLAAHLRPGASGGRDLWMVAQCPIRVNEGEVLCKEAGATDVLRDEPLAAINGLHEGSFDAVIDTIGGRRLYDASRRILHHSGSFITTIGDSLTPSSPSSSPSSFSNENFRSLRRAFFKKDKKAISYWRVNPDADEREAVRETLDQVRAAVEAGGLRLLPAKVLPFAEARRTFEERDAEEEVVVQVKET
ncbi:hypothetical protein JCM11251_007828 [Rhodosporidiobolus azoricus]